MAETKKLEIVLDQKFEPRTCRHYLNGAPHVLHCHHFATLYTQLAEDCGMLDGKKLLAEVAEDSFRKVLSDYYDVHDIMSLEDRIAIAEQYYAITGLGKMKVLFIGPDSGEVELEHSHLDEGWINKWGKRDKPANYITCGYIAGTFAAALGKKPRSFDVTETESIVAGAPKSNFSVVTV